MDGLDSEWRIDSAFSLVIPAQAGIQRLRIIYRCRWIPACAGMTEENPVR